MIDDKLLTLHTDGKWGLNRVPFDGVTKSHTGTLRWYKDGRYHREDGPSIVHADGTTEWWLHGRRHRKGGPAVEYADGREYWYIHGKYHREDGPAYEWADGSKFWYVHGKLHREDGPAIEYADGSKLWHIHGKRIFTWKEYHKLSTLSPQEQMVVKLRYGEELK